MSISYFTIVFILFPNFHEVRLVRLEHLLNIVQLLPLCFWHKEYAEKEDADQNGSEYPESKTFSDSIDNVGEEFGDKKSQDPIERNCKG